MVVAADGTLSVSAFDPGSLALDGARTVLADGIPIRNLATVDFGISATSRLAFVSASSSASDTTQMAWVSLDGRVTPVDRSWSFRPGGDFALSPDGKQIAVTVQGGTDTDVWLHDIPAGRTTRLTSDGAREPLFSADGNEVMFLKTVGNQAVLYALPVSGGRTERIVTQQRSAINTDATWTPRGDSLVFQTWRRGKGEDIMILPMRQGAPSSALLETDFNEMTPRLSPNGRWLAYVSDESGRLEVSERGGKEPEWSRDGRRLFYFDLADTLRAVEVGDAARTPIGRTTPMFSAGSWRRAPTATRSYYTMASSGDRFLVMLRMAGAGSAQNVVTVEDYPALLELRSRKR
jgi:serine/threonine-protein kinase